LSERYNYVKKANVDLIVGASILFSLIVLITGVLWLKEVSVSRKLVSYAALFPNVGTLQAGDPVMVNGITKGSIKKLDIKNNMVMVVFDLDRKIHLTDSCLITVQNIGLMGERGVGITLSTGGCGVPPVSRKDTTYLKGNFDTGIAEAMGMVGTVLSEVRVLAGNVSKIIDRTVGDSSFSQTFDLLLSRLDTITSTGQSILVDNHPKLDSIVTQVKYLTTELNTLIENNRTHINKIVTNGDTLLENAVTISNNADSLIRSVQLMIDKIDNGDGTVSMLIKDKQFYTDLKKSVADLDTLINDVQDNALKLRVKIGFGRQKKKETYERATN
jgi:phospholipid/cholesterol/gamma-HCH transport system substrate-binding protein